MPFRTTPILRVGDDGEWILETPLYYVTPAGDDIIVPPGFETDLASIPQIFHSIVPVNGVHRAAAIVHDWLYVTQPCTRPEADRVFLDAMADLGVRWSQRLVMYAAVRAGGWVGWAKRREALAK